MKCLILAAGYATRLYPLTENFPKPLLEINGKTIMDWLVDDIANNDSIDEFIIVSNHKFIDFFVEWKKNKNIGQKITIIDDGTMSNETRLGAVVDIDLAIAQLKIDDDLMVIAGDNVLDFSLNEFIDYYKRKKATCVMRYYEEDLNRVKKSASLVFDDNDRVLQMLEKPENPTSNYCCPPFYIYEKNDMKKVGLALKSGCKKDAPGSFINWLYDKSNIYAFEMPGKRYDIGNLESYKIVNETYKGISRGDKDKMFALE